MMMFLLTLSIITIPSVMALTSITIALNNKIIIEIEKYHVYYAIDNVFISENEKSNYILDEAECWEKPIYLSDDPSKTAYLYCDNVVMDFGAYKPNTRVELTNIEFIDVWNCEEQENQFLCNLKEIYTIDYWRYDREYYGEYRDDDIEIMNFKELLYDYWKDYGDFGFYIPNEFTMPNHDVYFIPPPV